MSKTQTLANAFGTLVKTLTIKAAVAKIVKATAPTVNVDFDQKTVNRQMRKFARGLKAVGVRRLRFIPLTGEDGGAAFRDGSTSEVRVAELTKLYTDQGTLKSVRKNAEFESTVLRLNYSRTARIEVTNKRVVFYA